MKKNTWILALFAALALLFTGCPGGGDDEREQLPDTLPTEGFIWVTFSQTTPLQDKARVSGTETTVTFTHRTGNELWGELVAPEATPWDASAYSGIKFEYRSPGNASVFAQDTNTIHIFCYDDSDGWGAISFADDWTPLELPFNIFKLPNNNNTEAWFGNNEPLNTSVIIKFAFQISPADTGDKFEIRNFEAY